MSKLYCLLLAVTLFLSFSSLEAQTERRSNYVLVSVAPHRFFVQKIAGNTLEVGLMVPAGASAHTYEPTPKQTIAAGKADIWFRIGESFEDKAIQALKSYKPDLRIADLRENLDLIYDHVCAHHKGSADLHFWLSPRLAKQQAQTIGKELAALYPENKDLYQANLAQFLQELDELDRHIVKALAPLNNRIIMVSHPAYGYYVRDYDLKQLSIEFEGKDPTPQQLTRILDAAKKNQIKTIFTQPQYSNKGAVLIAQEIGAKVVSLEPYAEDYYESLREITRQFSVQ